RARCLARGLLLFDAELLDSVAQRPKAHSEELRCGRFVVAALLEGLDDGIALDALELTAERGVPCDEGRLTGGDCAGRGGSGGRAQADVLGCDGATGAQRDSAFEHVLEFAHVSRERVRLERSDRWLRDLCRRAVGAPREPLEDRFSDLADIASALAQRR